MKNRRWYLIIVLLSFSASINFLSTHTQDVNPYELYVLPTLISVFSITLDILGRKIVLPIAMSVHILFTLSQYVKHFMSAKNAFQYQNIVHILVALIIILIGNYLPKTKPSRFVGLKFFWLLDKPVLWFKVHRLAGYLWILSGALMLSLGVAYKWFWIILYALL